MKFLLRMLILFPMLMHALPIAYVVESEFGMPGFLVPVDLATNTALTPIEVGINPTDVAITPNGKFAYVTNDTSGTVTPVNLVTNKALTPITVGTSPEAIAITPNGEFAYVANSASNNVSVINIATNQVIANIAGFNSPSDLAVTPDNKSVYVTNFAFAGSVSVIDVATNTLKTNISGFSFPDGIAITPNGQTAYVANENTGTVIPITIATNNVGTPITMTDTATQIAITPNGTLAYVIQDNGTVQPITIATNTAGSAFTIGPSGTPLDIAITPDGTKGAVTLRSTANLVQTFNIPSNTLDGSTSVTDPTGIAIAPFILPPASATAVLTKNKFLNTTECVLVMTITPAATSSPLSFNVYQNGVLIAQETSATFNLCLSSDCNPGGLFVTAVGTNGVESSPVSLQILS